MMLTKWPMLLKQHYFMCLQPSQIRSMIFVPMVMTVGAATSERESYQHKNGIPQCIVDEIVPVFENLSNSDLLQKCTHGLTQNLNECLNGLIWDRCPKTTYVEQSTVALATYLAVLKFNDGDISFFKIFEDLDIKPGVFTFEGAQHCDQQRI